MKRLLQTLWQFITSWRSDLKAATSKYLVTREVVKVLQLTHAQELSNTPRNEWAIVRQKQVEEIKAVQSGQQFDIVDRRSWCISEDSEILTGDGFKGVHEISKLDYVATLNPETNELEYYHPSKINIQKYNGKMRLFKGRGFNLLVTPNHKMIGKWHWRHYSDNDHNGWGVDAVSGVKAFSKTTFATVQEIVDYRDATKGSDYGFRVPFGAKWKGKYPENYNPETKQLKIKCKYTQELNQHGYENYKVDLKDFVAFLGIWIAEGSCAGNYQGVSTDKRTPKYIRALAAAADNKIYDRSRGYKVSVFQLKTSKAYSDIRTLLFRLPFDFIRDESQKGFSTNCKALHSFLYKYGNTYTKHIPQWVKDLPPEYLKIFIKWYIKGDGTVAKNSGNARWGYTTSRKLADDLQEVFLKIGRQAKVTKEKSTAVQYFGGDPKKCAPKYSVEEHLGRFTSLPRSTELNYKGLVWCVYVPPNGTILVRRCGKTMWTGNSYPYLPEALHRLRP